MNEIITGLTTNEKLNILADAAKYDVACTSSGVGRKGRKGALGNSVSCGICHSFAADGRCISLLKVLMTNHCVYDCKYCLNRRSNDVPRATFEPEELCDLVIEFYKRNYIEGLFLSSGVLRDPTYTMQRMCETLYLLRTKYRFNGYIHVKTIPGASDELISMVGYLADRISVNMELPTEESLKKLAPNKSFDTILDPMGKLTSTIESHRLAVGKTARMERSGINRYLTGSIFNEKNLQKDLTAYKAELAGQERHGALQMSAAEALADGMISDKETSVLPLRPPCHVWRYRQETGICPGGTEHTDDSWSQRRVGLHAHTHSPETVSAIRSEACVLLRVYTDQRGLGTPCVGYGGSIAP